ncbi:phage tail tape measure protein [Ureibacillus thermosphaericus]|uniref:TP901 family phage tail tape measure protein n=1 Tax=Ureibacillus thermosphaericus TaxID=51173 RepID=A0A840PRY4_URETH|nr:phage tail tape measure protein [Ureibacillus thermosphaericus]MBB5148660.1 TP901 family phage tail tape measure protein [Ureibacillus thermosphaericus]NKZ31375.1 phage tail tape measure protein [Ureibacillus thermosphaericus]
MSKIHELTVEISGNIGSSFTSAFKKATAGLADFQQQARQVQREIDRLGADFRQGRIHESQFREETEKLTRELNKLENAQKRVNAIKSFGTETWNRTKAVAGIALATGGAVATAAFAKSISTAADFEAQMAKVGAKAEATNAEMQALSKTALKLGASSSLSASEVAIGMDELAAKGMNARQIIDAMPGLIAAAESSGESLDSVSDVVTSAINSFGMEAKEASRVADIIAMSAIQSAADVSDLGHAFKYAAPAANTLGISLEELSAATGLLTDKGLAGEQAGTSLRMALIRLSKPPTAAEKALKKLNITAVDSDKKFKSLADITEEWNEATKDLSDTQKMAYAADIFGAEASTAMLSLFSNGADKIREMTRELENSEGAAARVARQMKQNFAGAKEQFFGAIESAQIAFGTPILDVLEDTFNGLSYVIENNLPAIENAGKAVANVLDNITKPFQVVEKPIKPEITPEMNHREVEEAMLKYQEDLKNWELYGRMDFSEKVEYALDETVETIDKWMQGDGGKALDSIFKELGTLAGKAWVKSFTTAVKGSVESIGEGNIVGGLAMAAAANMMTGGLLMKGGLSGGKWLFGKGKDIFSKAKSSEKTNKAVATIPTTVKETEKKPKGFTELLKGNKNLTKQKEITKAVSMAGKVGKGAGKILAPLAVLGYGADILTSDNKPEAVGSAVGGLSGAAAGVAAGAAIGSVIPGVGTVIGGTVGGIIGGLGGDWLGGKIGNLFGGQKASASQTPISDKAVASIDTSKLNAEIAKATNNASLLTQYLGQASGMIYGSFYPLQEKTNLASNNMSILTMYAGQASGMVYGSFYPLQEKTKLASHNMELLASYIGHASGWIYSLMNIQTAGQRVAQALNNLESRINSIDLSGVERRVSYNS